jgi:NitT/TauT family transport system substrate-binding protein
MCLSPQYVAEELLRLEGFNEVEYVDIPYTGGRGLTTGRADLSMDYAPSLVWLLDAAAKIIALAPVHSGCFALIGNERISAIRELKGHKVAVSGVGQGDYVFVASMAAYVGIDPNRDIEWLQTGSIAENARAFESGAADAFLGFPPQPQKLREKKLGHVIVDGSRDRPWSQYTCCLIAGTRDFVSRNPIATKRAIRAFLKAADMCARDPERAARTVVSKGFEQRYDVILKVLGEVRYETWREANPEDALRFYALRLHEVGLIKTSPARLIAQGTDWRLFNELRREMKL